VEQNAGARYIKVMTTTLNSIEKAGVGQNSATEILFNGNIAVTVNGKRTVLSPEDWAAKQSAMKALPLPPTGGNSRREYGIAFRLNGARVTTPVIAREGDTVTAEYLGGQWQDGATFAVDTMRLMSACVEAGTGKNRKWTVTL